jgi:O-antigen ligase
VNPLLNFLEQRFTIFSLIFFTGVLALSSFYIKPDSGLDSTPVFNPLEPILSLVQYAVYAIVLFLIFARWKSSIRAAIRDPIIWLLPVMAVMSFFWSDFPDLSLKKGIVTMQTTSFGLYMASRYSMKQQLQMLAWALGIIVVFSLLFSLAFPGAAIETGINAGSWRGPFVQKNVLARMMVLSAIVFLLVALENRRYRYILWGAFGLSILLILLSGSKTALLLLLTIIFLLPFYKALRWSDTVVIPLVIVAIVLAGSIAAIVVGNWENLLMGLGRDPTLSGRTTLWELAIELIGKRLWLGYGYQGFWKEAGGAAVIWKAEGYKPPHAHNGFVNISLDLGLIGLLFFLLTIAVTYFRGIAWLRLGRTSIELWPIFYATFFFMYNHSENTIIEHNSIFWVLLVSASLSMKRLRAIKPEYSQESPERNHSEPLLRKSKFSSYEFINKLNPKFKI